MIALQHRQLATTPPSTDFRTPGHWGIASHKTAIEVIQRSTSWAASYQTDNTTQWAYVVGVPTHSRCCWSNMRTVPETCTPVSRETFKQSLRGNHYKTGYAGASGV